MKSPSVSSDMRGPAAGRRARFCAVLALLILACGRPFAGPAENAGLVVAVYDGDTVKIRFANGAERKVRLIGIDSPEMDDPREDVGFMAFAAKRFAFTKLYRKKVLLSRSREVEDKYGRLLAYLSTSDGVLFNEQILRAGYAQVLRAFPHDPEMMKRFESAQKEAKREKRGLWRKGDPPEVPSAEVGRHLDEIVAVRTAVERFEIKKSFLVIQTSGGAVEALVPKSRRAKFPGIEEWAGRRIRILGLVEMYEGRLQIVLQWPSQIEIMP
jgi:micrococcal nuclease